MRRTSRECAFKYIFAQQFTTQEESEFLSELKERDAAFAKEIIECFSAHKQDLEERVRGALVGYEMSRVYKADMALLMLALCEIDYLGTPKQVAINEVVEIAKKYSTGNSSKFINGVLATLVKGQ